MTALPVRSPRKTVRVIAVAGDWACDADVTVDGKGDAKVLRLSGFEFYPADADDLADVAEEDVPADVLADLRDAAAAAYYEATDLDDSDPPDPWRG